MTVGELIKHLERFPSDTLVVRHDYQYGHGSCWKSMDGWWPQMVTLVASDNPLKAGIYWEASAFPTTAAETGAIDALEI